MTLLPLLLGFFFSVLWFQDDPTRYSVQRVPSPVSPEGADGNLADSVDSAATAPEEDHSKGGLTRNLTNKERSKIFVIHYAVLHKYKSYL